MLYMFKPETPDAPNRSNRNPPTRAPTIPRAMSSQKPCPCRSTILLPRNPAIRPSINNPAEDTHNALLLDALLLARNNCAAERRFGLIQINFATVRRRLKRSLQHFAGSALTSKPLRRRKGEPRCARQQPFKASSH